MDSKGVDTYVGIVFIRLLTLIFITLKLTHVISWSWWWVLLPLWGPVALVTTVLLVFLIGLGILFVLGRD